MTLSRDATLVATSILVAGAATSFGLMKVSAQLEQHNVTAASAAAMMIPSTPPNREHPAAAPVAQDTALKESTRDDRVRHAHIVEGQFRAQAPAYQRCRRPLAPEMPGPYKATFVFAPSGSELSRTIEPLLPDESPIAKKELSCLREAKLEKISAPPSAEKNTLEFILNLP